MLQIVLLVIVFSVSGAGTTVLLGDRGLLSGNMLDPGIILQVIFNWRFISAFLLAFIARYSFMMINSELLKNPAYAPNSTSITAFITSVSVVFMLAANWHFLGEKMNTGQFMGIFLIMSGIWFVLK